MTDNTTPDLANASPEFLAAVEEHHHAAEALGHDHPQVKRLMQRAMALAPRTLLDTMQAKAHELGLMPEPDGYLDNGQPLYSLEVIARQNGMTVEEVQAGIEELLETCGDLPVMAPIDPARVHRVQ